MGTHEAPRGRALRAAPAPPAGPPVLPPTTTWDAPVAAAPFLVEPPYAGPPAAPVTLVPPVAGLDALDSALAAPSAPAGSSGLVPLRAPEAPAPAPAGFVPGAPNTAAAATRLRWDEKGARRRASVTTFGLTGRIVITVVVLLLVAVLSYGNPFGIPLFLGAAAWLLRDLWAKARVAPPRAPVRAPVPRGPSFPPSS